MTDLTASAPEAAGAGAAAGASVAVAVLPPLSGSPTRWNLLLRRAILLFWVVCALFGRSIAPFSPLTQQLLGVNAGPSGTHWFGTDQLGRDVLSRVIVGARDILIITPLATVLGAILGTILGL